ncbi:DUF2715 domain-containing protein [Treponema sp. OMZ 840]|uniref:DUF2715 domain-containing protein n=1 Tax=Treponema sp. OMZ 840 TaxID=244313 RepID=UPI003D8DEA19
MKQKRLLIAAVVLLVSAVFVFADTAISIGPAFTNYLVRTKMEGGTLPADVQAIVGDSFGNLKDEKNNAAGFALDVRGRFLYGMIQMAFPAKTHSDIINSNINDLKNSAIIFDSQLGAGFTFFKKSPFNLFIGGGVGLNTMYAQKTMKLPVTGNEVSYAKLDFMLGAGANVLAQFYFTKHLGIYAGIADTVYFAPLVAKKEFKLPDGSTYNYGQSSDTQVKNTLANSLNVKAGLTIKF